MVIVALTGGIGSGKSTVARMFEDEGAYVIDFDYLARVVVKPDKPAWRDIVDYFGPEILSPDRTLNRSALAEIVFSDDESRKALEGFTHHRIFEESDALVKAIKRKDPCSVVIIDFPLLFELSLNEKFDKVIYNRECGFFCIRCFISIFRTYCPGPGEGGGHRRGRRSITREKTAEGI